MVKNANQGAGSLFTGAEIFVSFLANCARSVNQTALELL
jgi:hypothetical protein